MMVQRIEGSRCDDSSLTEATPELLLEPSCPINERFRASKAGAYRGPESLREAHAHSVKCRSILRFRDASLCRGMPETGSVKMNGDSILTGPSRHRFHLFQRPDRSAANVVRVLDAEQLQGRRDRSGKKRMGHPESGFNILWSEDATDTGKQTGQHSRQRCRSSTLKKVDMCVLIKEHCISGLSVRTDSDLIGHSARHHVHGILFAK